MSEPVVSSSAPASATVPARPPRFASLLAGAVTGALLLGVGLVGGYVSGKQSAAPAAAHEGEGAPAGEEGKEPAAKAGLSAQTLANLGVEVGELATTEFVRTRDVPAVAEARPDAVRAVHAPVGGTVRRILVRWGQTVRAGDPVAEIVRDAFPRPALTLTDAVLKPLNEDFHHAISELRVSAQALSIARTELERIQKVLESAGGTQSLPGKAEIDLRHEVSRSLRALENARSEARRHGLSDEEVAALEAGGSPTVDQPPAQRILERNRLWSPAAEEILALLPTPMRESPYTVAVLGELSGVHALTPDVVVSLRAHPPLAAAFLDLAGLLQQGTTVAALEALADAGALGSLVTIPAPAEAPDWDVTSLPVRAGARVEAGADLAILTDGRRARLRLAPAGPDVPAVERAFTTGDVVTAEPLVTGAGPTYDKLVLARLDTATSGGTSSALIEVENEALAPKGTGEGPATRTWRLREGVRYVIRVPSARLPGRFVVPAEAVVPRGADFVLVLADGKGFRQVPVHVEYSDSRIAVIANDGAVFPGDRAVLRGAYALSLALQASGGGGAEGGGHAGHHH